MKEMQYRTIELDRAAIDDDKRVIPASLSSEAPASRSFGSEVLLHTKAAINMERADKGLPLLFSHDRDTPIGRVENIQLDGDKLRGLLRFSKNPKASEVWEDVRSGILTDISIGYRINDYEETDTGINATNWMPFEASVVTVPADSNVGINRSEETQMDKETEITEDKTTEVSVVDNVVIMNKRTLAQGVKDGMKAERKRVADISDVFALHDGEQVRELEKVCIDGGFDFTRSQHELLKLLGGLAVPVADDLGFAQSEEATATRPTAHRNQIIHGATSLEKVSQGIREAMYVKARVGDYKDFDMSGNEFAGLPMAEMARAMLKAQGVNTRGKSQWDISGMVFSRHQEDPAYTNTTAGYTDILADVAYLTLQGAYQEAPETWRMWCGTGSAQDFKQSNYPNLSEFPDLEPVAENGVYPTKQMSDWSENITIGKQGALFDITREALVNDSTSAFQRVASAMGIAAARSVGDAAYLVLTANGLMNEDNTALFASAHNNIGSGAGNVAGISVETVDTARVAMALQTGAQGATLNLRPQYLICPVGLEGTATTLRNSQFDPDGGPAATEGATNRVNWVAGTFDVITDPRLDADNSAGWYMTTPFRPGSETVQVNFLNGVEAPYLEQQAGFTRDGITYKVRMEFGVGALDWRTMYYNDGTTV